MSAYNVYVYCAGNPVVYCDTTGEFILTTMAICCIAGVIVGATAGGVIGNVYADKQGYSGPDKTKCILAGVGIGALAGGICGYFSAPLITSATGIAGVSVSSTGIIVGQNVVSNINSLDANSINHIINGSKGQDHRWNVLVSNMDWNSIRYYVMNTLVYGHKEIQGSAFRKTIKYGEYIVEVRYAVKDGIIKIGDAIENEY